MRNLGFRILALGMWLMMVTMLTAGCGNGFSSSKETLALCGTSCANSGLDNQNPNTPPENEPTINPEDFAGVMDAGGGFNSMSVVNIDLPNKMIEFRLPLLADPFLEGVIVDVPIPQIPGAWLGLTTLPDGRKALTLKMPIEKYLQGIAILPPNKLPNGDPLPGIPDGELPSTAIELNNIRGIKATLYLAPTVVGIFVNSSFDPFIKLTLPIRNKDRRILGYFSTVPAKKLPTAYDGGFFVSFALPDDLARKLNELM